MELIRFNSWSVSPYGIDWKGRTDIKYSIPLHSLVHTGVNKRAILYQWLIEIARDKRLTSEDVYSLNTAFFYALDMFKTELDIPNYVLIAETLKAQQELIDEKRFDNIGRTG